MAFYVQPYMVFVDGENFTIRGQEFAKAKGIDLVRGALWEPDTFLWLPDVDSSFPRNRFSPGEPVPAAERSYYHTAVVGDDDRVRATRLAIRGLGFEPSVFKKAKGTKSKGVDVSLTTNVVAHAHRASYEVAYLVAGDGDYAPMVEEVKRAGRRVVAAFFAEHGLNPELQIAADNFIDISESFFSTWKRESDRVWAEAKASEFLEVDPQAIRRQPEQFGLDKNRARALLAAVVRLQRDNAREAEPERG